MKLEHMREFLNLAETLNYSMSANSLYISQSTLSRHVQLLEKEVGFALVKTSSHGVELTKSGELALQSFRKIVGEYDRFISKCNYLSEQVTGTIKIGILYYAMDDYFSGFLEMFGSKYPNVDLSIYHYQPQPLYEDLRSGKIDIASLAFYDRELKDDLKLQLIGYQKLVAMMRKDHPLCKKEQVSLEELTYSDLIELRNDDFSNTVSRELLQRKRVYFNKIHMTDNIETVPMMIRKTGAIHITGESCRRQNAAGICYKDISGAGIQLEFCLGALHSNDNPLIDLVYAEAVQYFSKNR